MKKYLVALFLLLGVAFTLHHYLHESPVPNHKTPEVIDTAMKRIDTSALVIEGIDSTKIIKHNSSKNSLHYQSGESNFRVK